MRLENCLKTLGMEGGKMESSKIVGLPTKIKRYLNNYIVINVLKTMQ